MFGRGGEVLNYTVEPTKEGTERLAERALERIETVDGVDYLDGYNLPPDNDEVFGPETITMRTTRIWEDDGGELWCGVTETTYPSKMTNSFIRRCNIRSIAQGRTPLFRTWEEIGISRDTGEPREPVRVKVSDFLNSVFEKIAN